MKKAIAFATVLIVILVFSVGTFAASFKAPGLHVKYQYNVHKTTATTTFYAQDKTKVGTYSYTLSARVMLNDGTEVVKKTKQGGVEYGKLPLYYKSKDATYSVVANASWKGDYGEAYVYYTTTDGPYSGRLTA